MGLFGSISPNSDTARILSLVGGWGANLRDAANGVSGPDHIAAAQQAFMQRQQLAQQQAIGQRLAGMFGSQAPAPQPTGPSVSDMVNSTMTGQDGPTLAQVTARPMPQVAQQPNRLSTLAQAAAAGYNIDDFVKLAQMDQPDIRADNGFLYNAKDPTQAGMFHPSLEKGQEPLYNARGQVVGIRNMDGSVQSAADMAGAVAGAQEAAKAPYSFQTVTGPDGRPRVISAQTAAALGANGGFIATGRNPEEQATAGAKAAAQTGAQIELPQTMAAADQALKAIDELRNDKALPSRTGLWGIAPSIPGTPGADFDARVEQLRGKLFLEAYAGLKGGGQITEVEGAKAQAAIGRLNTKQTPEGFKAALNDLEEVIKAGKERAQQKAGGYTGDNFSQAALLAEARKRGLVQ